MLMLLLAASLLAQTTLPPPLVFETLPAAPPPGAAQADGMEELAIRWRPSAAPSGTLVAPASAPAGDFELLTRRLLGEAVGFERNPELSDDRLVAVAVDAAGNVVSWQILLDPRLVRAEQAAADGSLTAVRFHRSETRFTVVLPRGAAAALNLYQPRWNGVTWLLDPIGRVTLGPDGVALDAPTVDPAPSPVTTIRNHGSSMNRVDLVILGDGYTAAEISSGKWAQDAETFVQGVFAQQPYAAYQFYFNVHRVDVASAQSGADHPPSVFRDTAFDATYNCANIERLICVNFSKVQTALVDSVPSPAARDIVLVIVNDTEYGGSGGSISVASTNAAAVELILHEQGHTFGLLADEYGGPPPPECNNSVEPAAVNATQQTTRSLIKWNHWIDGSTPVPTNNTINALPGLYQGAQYCDFGLYRPTFNSKMRSLGQGFHHINIEQHVRRVYNFVSPIDSTLPAEASITLQADTTRTFSVSIPQPVGSPLSVAWRLDGVLVGSGPSYSLVHSSVASGTHTLSVHVQDPTAFVRHDPANVLRATRSWTVTVLPANGSGIDLNGDGRLDLLWHHQTDGRLSGWLMNGINLIDGTLLTPSSVPDTNWKVVGAGDLDADGHVDLVWQNIADGRVSAWLMTGLTLREGTLFSIPQVPDTQWRIRSVGDLNGDGKADLFWQHDGTGDISVWLMDGLTVIDGTLLTPSRVDDLNWKIVGTADFDGNGSRDLVWHHQGDGRIAIWFMNGTSQIGGSLTNPGQVADLTWKIRAVGDLNGDGRPDLLWQNIADGRLSVWYMNGLNLIDGSLLNPSQVPDTNWHIVGPR
jgi:hypothetical protein